MKEERFEASMEHFGDAIEKTVEGAAKAVSYTHLYILDNGITCHFLK